MSQPLVRAFQDEDRAAVVALWEVVFPNEPMWNEFNHLIDQKLTVQRELFFVCELDGQIVGTTLAGYDGVRGWVHKVACHPDQRKQGVAQALMAAAESSLVKLGCVKLNLQMRAGNDGARAFYEAIGYAIEDRVSLSKHLR